MSALTETYTLSNGHQIPKIGFGTWLLKEGDECYNAVADALRLGYRHIDTARAYENEASVGRAVRDSGLPREEVYVTSKLPAEAKAYDVAVETFETTMREIGMDYLDLYLVHAVGRAGCGLQRAEPGDLEGHGGVPGQRPGEAIGVSNFDADDLASLLPACQTKPMVNQIRWFVGLDPSETVAACSDHNIVVEAYSPFAHGLIVNHPEIEEMAKTYDVSAPQLCIRYLLQKGAVVLPKATSEEHIAQNAELDFEISADDMATLDAMRDTEQHKDAMEFRWS